MAFANRLDVDNDEAAYCMRRLSISLKRGAAIEVDRISIGDLRLVYVICANKRLRYPKGESRIAYIGTTKNGISRFAQSAASRSHLVLRLRGVTSFQVRLVTCGRRQRVKSWRKLERGLILAFRDRFGAPPRCNAHGRKLEWSGEQKLFAPSRLRAVIEDLS